MATITATAVGVPRAKLFHLHVFGTDLDTVPLSKWRQLNIGQVTSVALDLTNPSTHVVLTILAPQVPPGSGLDPVNEGNLQEKTEPKGEFVLHIEDTVSITSLTLTINGSSAPLPIVIE